MKKRVMAMLATAAMALGMLSGCGKTDDTFMIGWVSDPQWYSFKYFDRLTAQNEWIVEHYDELGMEYIVHTGDFVNLPHNTSEWDSVHPEYVKWDEAGLRYGVLAGNHDVDGRDATEYQQYFGEDRFNKNKWYIESYDNNRGHYDRLTLGGVDFVFVYMSHGDPLDEDIDWLNRVLAENAECIAVLAFHDYLIESGERSSTGEIYFNRVVLKNPNVRMVLCGHNYNAVRRADDVDDNGDGNADRTVYQMMANYQNLENGGDSYFRMMECNVKEGTIASTTYSPYLDDYNAYDNSEAARDEYGYQDEFVLPFDFSAPAPREGETVGTVIVNSRVAFAATETAAGATVDAKYFNTVADGDTFDTAGVYDRNFSLTATDAFKDPKAINYVIVRYNQETGHCIDRIVKGADLADSAVVAIPHDGAVVALASDALDVDTLEIGQHVAYSKISGLAGPVLKTFDKTITFPWGETYGIYDLNRGVGSDQWIAYDRTGGETTAKAGFTHEWNFLASFEPTDNENEYKITAVDGSSGAPKDMPIPEKGFVLAINSVSGVPTLGDSMDALITVGVTVTVDGYTPAG
ncbi:MAG: metallophosphoesterase [Clostridia bacterium]|nr:metallophosphoesterase [Clostridia bacterium]